MTDFGCIVGCQGIKNGRRSMSVRPILSGDSGAFDWLGCRDSNPNYLIQSQASYR